ncbi:MAG: tRNA (adenosine(37)-N6)-threonylcarbamoyltransferase complex dimerization subunit type 1 TsaB [Burkholderiaceae bacterium]
MKLLALDTSTERLCVALCLGEDEAGVYTHEEPGGAQASVRLLPAAEDLLKRHGLRWNDLDGLAFGQGPGAFTGLRGTCAAVQGLALGLGLRAVAVPSLRIVAEDARQQAIGLGLLSGTTPCAVRVAVDARMGQVYEGAGAWDGQTWKPLSGPSVRAPDTVALDWLEATGASGCGRPEALTLPWVLAGSGLDLMPTDAVNRLKPMALAWVAEETQRAQSLGRCARLAWRSGQLRLDAAQVMPLYVRDQVALTTDERQRVGATQAASTPAGAQVTGGEAR